MAHIHLYRQYPPKRPKDFVGCINKDEVPDLDVGDEVEHEGVVYGALPCWRGDVLVVQRDVGQRAQVATPLPRADSDKERKELVGVGAGSTTEWPHELDR